MGGEPYEVLGVDPSAPWDTVRAAYLALARQYHPDGAATPDSRRMATVNAAYQALERRRRSDSGEPRLVPMGPGTVPPATAGPGEAALPGPSTGSLLWRVQAAQFGETPTLDFGQYAGWRIADVARHDPRYLRWLSRHSSGVRFRRAIEKVLGSEADVGRRAAILG